MNRLTASIALLLCLSFLMACQTTPSDPEGTSLSVMSFNIRNGRANDGENSWSHRRPLVYEVIREAEADLVGIQEAFDFQLADLAEHLPAYAQLGAGRDGGTRGEHCTILYRRERFEVVDAGTFWLSDTPGKVSRSWGNRHHRVCTWARFVDRGTGQAFYVFNTHLDHQSQRSRFNSAVLIARRIAERPTDDPVILTGDFNAGEDNAVIRYLTGEPVDGATAPVSFVDTFRVIHPDREDAGTGNGGYTGRVDGPKIDYVLAGPGVETIDAQIDQSPRAGRYPSDHYPVSATIRLVP